MKTSTEQHGLDDNLHCNSELTKLINKNLDIIYRKEASNSGKAILYHYFIPLEY